MPINRVVVNASPLICLYRSGLLGLLPSLFKEIVVPELVVKEIMAKEEINLKLEKQIYKFADVAIVPPVASWDLGNGESAVLTFALKNPEHWAVIDDREARRCAVSLGCRYTGTVGIIVLAKKKGIITSVNDSMEKLRNAGLWLSETFVNEVCKKAGEW